MKHGASTGLMCTQRRSGWQTVRDSGADKDGHGDADCRVQGRGLFDDGMCWSVVGSER